MNIKLNFLVLFLALGFAAIVSPGAALADEAMGCFIDTPAFDTYSMHSCFRLGSQSSVAVFKVFGLDNPAFFRFNWSHSGCSGVTCSIPISPGQTLGAWVQFEDLRSGATDAVAATAYYELEPIGF